MSENDEATDYIDIDFDDGTQGRCEVQGVFDLDGEEYIALLPEDGSDDVYLYGYHEYEEDQTYELVDILDDDLFQRVSDRYDEVAAEQAEIDEELAAEEDAEAEAEEEAAEEDSEE